MIPIKGIQKTTLVDYPGKIACTLFLGGCNMRCGYCHNRDLALNHTKLDTIPSDEILAFLEKRKKYLQGLCITGGEPTIHKDLPLFIEKIKKIGYKVKLDTNGTNPAMLQELISHQLIDFIAMDIKASLNNYSSVCGVSSDKEKIIQSVNVIMNSPIEYEFRTTIIPDVIDDKEIKKIGNLIKGAKRYALQQFTASEHCIGKKYQDMKALSLEQLYSFKELIKDTVHSVEIRNII
jgi:pyruvate formate lyase activating enzyme